MTHQENDLKTFGEQLGKSLAKEEARYVYADTVTNTFVSAQIKALREDRDLSQEELAELVGTKQSGISRLEKADYSAWKIETLRKLAKAFGVRLRIRFEEFGTLIEEVGGFKEKNLLPRKFEQDPVFNAGKDVTRRSARSSRKFRFSIKERRIVGRRRKPAVSGIPKKPQSVEVLTPARNVVGSGMAEQPGPVSGYHPTAGNNSNALPIPVSNQAAAHLERAYD